MLYRRRWAGVLDSSLKRDDWTDEEDRIIQEAVKNSQKPGDIARRLNRPVGMVRLPFQWLSCQK